MKQTDQEILQEVWTEARRILREYIDAGPDRDPDAALLKLFKTLVNERINPVVERVERRGTFKAIQGEVSIDPETGRTVILGPRIPAGQADLYGVPKATE